MTKRLVLLQAPQGEPDDLSKLTGVGAALEKALNDVGVFHFWQITALTPDDISELESKIAVRGRRDWKVFQKEAEQLAKDRPAPHDGGADFSTEHSAPSPGAADAAAHEAAAAGAGASPPVTDKPGPESHAGGAAQSSAAPQGGAPDFADFPVAQIASMPADVLARAVLVVTARQDQRRRAGIDFSRGETHVPLSLVDSAQIAAIDGDPVLTVHVRVHRELPIA